MTTNEITTTASQQYDEHQDAILALLDELTCDLAIHSRNFDKDGRRNWAYIGDLAHIEEMLEQVAEFTNNKE